MRNLEHQLVKLNVKSLSDEDKSNLKQLMKLKQLQSNKIQKPLWVELSKEDFSLLIKDIANSLDDGNYETTVNNQKYDLKDAEKCLLEITSRKISKIEAFKLYDDLIKGDIAVLKEVKDKSKDKRQNILMILKNLESIFTGTFLWTKARTKSWRKYNSGSKKEKTKI